jgi:hypothetical protein
MPRKPRRPYDPRAKALRAQRPPADAVSYMPPPGRLSLIIKLVGTDQDRLTRPGERGLYCYTDRLSYRPGDTVRFHTSTSAPRYSIEIARVGARREVLWTRSGLPGHLEYGDVFGSADRIVGYECDGLDFVTRNGLPYPTGKDGTPMTTEILALAPTSLGERPSAEREVMWDQRDLEAVVRQLERRVTPAGLEKYRHGTAAVVTFTRGKGTVFNCGSTEWVYGLQGR